MSIHLDVKTNREKLERLQKELSYTLCGKEHNNAEDTCLECEVIKRERIT